MTPLQDGVALLGRLLLALLFLLSGFQKLTGFGATVACQEGLLFVLGAAIVTIVVECVGGVALVLGYQTRLTGAAENWATEWPQGGRNEYILKLICF
jgi:putative oxidoreductase